MSLTGSMGSAITLVAVGMGLTAVDATTLTPIRSAGRNNPRADGPAGAAQPAA